jgi:MoaA/NifB/PqqE/SkfB family radical SAM enzyme
VDKLLLSQPVEWKGMCKRTPRFFRADWSITNQCDLNCGFCGGGQDTISYQSCQTCVRRHPAAAGGWTPPSSAQFVQELASAGIQVLHIRGGNPLLAWDRLREIVRAARQIPLQVVITTPASGQEAASLVRLASGRHVLLNIVMFGIDDETARSVCGQSGLFKRQAALIDHLVARRLPVGVTFFLTRATRSRRADALEFTRCSWGIEASVAEIYPRDELEEGFSFSHVENDRKPLSPWRSPEEFYFRVRHSSCTYGNFEVGCDGKLRSCAGIHRVHGDVAHGGLRQALAGDDLYILWDAGKASLQPCAGCALRYACTDCLAVEQAGESDRKIRRAYCPREPGGAAPITQLKTWDPPGFAIPLAADDGAGTRLRSTRHKPGQ